MKIRYRLPYYFRRKKHLEREKGDLLMQLELARARADALEVQVKQYRAILKERGL